MSFWLDKIIIEIRYFIFTWHMRNNYWGNPERLGYLVEDRRDGEIAYSIQDAEGHELLVEIDELHNYIVRKMKRAGVPIIPLDIMMEVWGGKRKYEDVINEYSQRSQRK